MTDSLKCGVAVATRETLFPCIDDRYDRDDVERLISASELIVTVLMWIGCPCEAILAKLVIRAGTAEVIVACSSHVLYNRWLVVRLRAGIMHSACQTRRFKYGLGSEPVFAPVMVRCWKKQLKDGIMHPDSARTRVLKYGWAVKLGCIPHE